MPRQNPQDSRNPQDSQDPQSPLHDFATWEPLLRFLSIGREDGGRVSGRIGQDWYGLPTRISDLDAETEVVGPVRVALHRAGLTDVGFTAELSPTGATDLHVVDYGPAAEPGFDTAHPGALLLVEGARPEPWRRLPVAVPGARPAASADPALLARTLRERLPGAIGATEEEIAATEARLGVRLPEEVKALYRVTRGRWEDWGGDNEAEERFYTALPFDLVPLDALIVAGALRRDRSWRHAATEAARGETGDAVQHLVTSPGWIAIGHTGGGDEVAVDLTPGPAGHLGQIIVLDTPHGIGASLFGTSLTELVLDPEREWESAPWFDRPYATWIHRTDGESIEAATHPDLEVLCLGRWEGEPFSLAPVLGLPRLRTLVVYSGGLADPLEIAGLTGLEFLALPPAYWRLLLDAGAVPRGLLAASISIPGGHVDPGTPGPRETVALANEILALRNRPPITETAVPGSLC